MSQADEIAALRQEVDGLRGHADRLNEAVVTMSRAIRKLAEEVERQRPPSFVDALLDSQTGRRILEMTATEAAMHERIRRRARFYRKEDDQ